MRKSYNEYKEFLKSNPNNQEVMFHEEREAYFFEDFVGNQKVTIWLGKKVDSSLEEYNTTEVQKTELFNDIYSIIKQLPMRVCEGDCMDVISCSKKIEELFYKYNQKP